MTTRSLRVMDPSDTLARVRPLWSEVGITRLADLTGLDVVGIPVFSAIRPNSRSLSVSQGKGVTAEDAMASAVMESIEYWHAENPRCPLRHDSWQGMVGEGGRSSVIDVHRMPLRGELDGVDAESRPTPARARFDERAPLVWAEGFSVYSGEPTWVPFETVHLNKVAFSYEASTFRVSSNGLASGNTADEALLHALCELVERDAVARWWRQLASVRDVARAAVDQAAIADPACRGLLNRLDEAGVLVSLLDITPSLSLPTYQACLLDREPREYARPLGPCWGYGTHPHPDVAISRALTEAAQTRVTSISGAREDNFTTNYTVHHSEAHRRATARLFFSARGTRRVGGSRFAEAVTAQRAVEMLLERFLQCGVGSVVAVDLTVPLWGLPVLKLIVPGLEHFSSFRDSRPSPSGTERAEDRPQ